MNCAVEWKGTVYIGDDAGNIHTMQDSLDNVLRDGTGGDPVEFSFLTAYSDLDAPGLNKRVHLIRPRFFSENGVEPSYNTKALYDYDINEPTLSIPTQSSDASAWDTGLWDSAIWGGDSVAASGLLGSCGVGQVIAIAVKGEATDRSTFLDASVYAEVGGAFL